MSDLEMAAVVLGMAVVTVVTRNLLMMTGPYWTPSNSRLSSLRYAPAAGLAALVIPDIVAALQDAVAAGAAAGEGWIRLAAVLTTILVYAWTRSSGITLLAGSAVYLLVYV